MKTRIPILGRLALEGSFVFERQSKNEMKVMQRVRLQLADRLPCILVKSHYATHYAGSSHTKLSWNSFKLQLVQNSFSWQFQVVAKLQLPVYILSDT
jgi:hypothetical protein